ncbi:MAG: hypothetical protein N4A49_14645 [Marinifilaceae bacterium]|jgi:hypothetical protein|nr:hypothetical protein [Marinifilaceae bacterium]
MSKKKEYVNPVFGLVSTKIFYFDFKNERYKELNCIKIIVPAVNKNANISEFVEPIRLFINMYDFNNIQWTLQCLNNTIREPLQMCLQYIPRKPILDQTKIGFSVLLKDVYVTKLLMDASKYYEKSSDYFQIIEIKPSSLCYVENLIVEI